MAEMPDEKSHTRGRRSRRVTKPAKPGVDDSPAALGRELAAEDDPRLWGDGDASSAQSGGANSANDDRLKRDKPPHWG